MVALFLKRRSIGARRQKSHKSTSSHSCPESLFGESFKQKLMAYGAHPTEFHYRPHADHVRGNRKRSTLPNSPRNSKVLKDPHILKPGHFGILAKQLQKKVAIGFPEGYSPQHLKFVMTF